MTPDEVRRMKRSDCLVMISGEAPVRDKKYNLFDHPNLKLHTLTYPQSAGAACIRAGNPHPRTGGLHDASGLYGAGRHRIARLCGGADLPRNYRRLYDELQEWEESLL